MKSTWWEILRHAHLKICVGVVAAGLVTSCITSNQRAATPTEPPPKAAPSTPVDREEVPDVQGQLRRPPGTQKTNQAAIDVIKEAETLQLTAYQGLRHMLIGYGHAGGVKPGMRITVDEAERLLAADLRVCEAAVTRTIKRTLTNNEFSALVSLCFNIGEGAFARSRVARLVNQGHRQAAADAILSWRKSAGKVRRSLVKRRHFERVLFLSHDGIAVANPPATQERLFASGSGLSIGNPTYEPSLADNVAAYAAMTPLPSRKPVRTFSLANLRASVDSVSIID